MLPLRPFYMIRHGESEANAAHITAGGQLDSPLTLLGVQQAESLASVIGQLEVKPHVIYHSYMKRAKSTAENINKTLGLEMIERYDLREHDMGEYDGVPWDQILPKLESKQFPEQGETEEQFSARIRNALHQILSGVDESTIPMVVAHGGLFHALGFMYEFAMSPIQNCHLHFFEPHPENALFPWKVMQFDIDDDALIGSSAVFCEPLLRQAS